MTTYVLRFLGTTPDDFRGRVRHVGSGEERTFTSPEELYDFLERMNAAHAPVAAPDAARRGPSELDDA